MTDLETFLATVERRAVVHWAQVAEDERKALAWKAAAEKEKEERERARNEWDVVKEEEAEDEWDVI